MLIPFLLSTLAGCHVEREIYFECPSPDGRWVAKFYREYGGGAAGFQYEFVDVQSTEDVNQKPSTVLGLNHGYDARLVWLDSLTLRIVYPDSSSVDHWQNRFGRRDEGRVELIAVPSHHGAFVSDTAGCAPPGRAA